MGASVVDRLVKRRRADGLSGHSGETGLSRSPSSPRSAYRVGGGTQWDSGTGDMGPDGCVFPNILVAIDGSALVVPALPID
jgi:hypothetical protein